MQPTDTTAFRNPRKKSAGYIIAGTAVLLIIAAAILGNNLSGTKKSEIAQLSDKLKEESQVLKNDVLLHEHFRKLQDLDEVYATMVMNSAIPSALDSLDLVIQSTEKKMKNTLTSVKTEAATYNVWSNVVMSDSMVSSFSKALSNRKYMATIRNAVSGKPIAINSDDKELMQLQFTMQEKEEQIISLEKELRSKTAVAAPPATVVVPVPQINNTELQKKNTALEASLREEELRNTGLLDVTRTLRQENEKLLADIGKVRRNNTDEESSATATRTKVASLQDQVNDLSAELNFAKIDCNLSRADSKKIISNSRQRKELLAQALQSLQTLNKSDNAVVQRRAREKLSELNQIASTVRD